MKALQSKRTKHIWSNQFLQFGFCAYNSRMHTHSQYTHTFTDTLRNMLSDVDEIDNFLFLFLFFRSVWFESTSSFDSSSIVEHSKFTDTYHCMHNLQNELLDQAREREEKTVHIFIRISVGVCALNYTYTHTQVHTHVAKLFNLWTCFANDVNGSMQVVNVCYCLFRTSYDDSTLLFLRYFHLCRAHTHILSSPLDGCLFF